MNEMDEQLAKVVAHHDAWSGTYDADIGAWTLYNRITWENIQRFLPSDKEAEILDAGGGTGMWAVQVAQAGYRVMLTDLSAGMLQKASEKVAALGLADRIEIRVSDIRAMPEFADGQFGMVMCEGDPLSYCGDHEAAVREFSRVVSPGGAVLASVDNRAAALNWLRDSEDREAIERLLATGEVRMPHLSEDARYAVHAFTPDELERLFESNGLTVERILGKPAFAWRLSLRSSEDPAVQEWLFEMEREYCDKPAYYPWGGHIEIAGRKR